MNRLPPDRVWNAIVTAPAPPPTCAPAAERHRHGFDGIPPRRDGGEEAVGVAQEVVVVADAVERDAQKVLRQAVDRRVAVGPGRCRAGTRPAFSALRVGVGMRVSWSEFSVAATVPFSVLMSSALLVTRTVSSSWPISSVSG